MANTERTEYEILLKDKKFLSDLSKAISKSSKLDSSMSKLSRSTKKQGSVFSGLLKFNVYGALASGAAEFASFAMKAGVEMEKTRISFQTMVGDVDKGNALFKEVAEFANVTPFSTAGVQKAGRTLLAFGVEAEAVVPTLSTLGDISAGTGKDLSELGVIYGQIKGAGRLMGQDLLQLINAGFNPLQQISKRTGESMGTLKDRMSKGAVSFREVQQAFVDATSEGGTFYQMSEKQSKTLGGLWSTLTGKLSNSIGLFMEGNSGIFKSIVSGALEVFDFFSNQWEGIKAVFSPLGELVDMVSNAFSEMFGTMGEGVTVTDVLKGAFNMIGTAIRFIMPALRAIVRGWVVMFKAIFKVGEAVVDFFKKSKTAQLGFKTIVSSMVAGFVYVKEAATNILSGVGDLLAGIFSGDVSKIEKGLEGLKGSFSSAGSTAAKAFEESYSTESKNYFDDEKKKKENTNFGNLGSYLDGKGDTAASMASGGKTNKKASSSVSGVASGRPTTVNIDIQKLIETFNVTAQGIDDLENQVAELVNRALISAVNDINLVAR